ncbi:MAG: class I SAM-dependent methyltransferase [Bacteroidota bacterium]
MQHIMHRIGWVVRNAPNLLRGYNIYVNTEKLRLIDRAFSLLNPPARSFADLGGVWKVNAAYTKYTLRSFSIDRGVIVDTDYPQAVERTLSKFPKLSVLQGDFTTQQLIDQVKPIDLVYFFDVLLHQANPNWDKVLTAYARVARCFVIFNQQYIRSKDTIRLTELPLEDYIKLVPVGRETLYRKVYAQKEEIHPTYGKPWGDIHNIFQWGITDNDLRSLMTQLGFSQLYYCNYGRFSNLSAFENHAFIFMRDSERSSSL